MKQICMSSDCLSPQFVTISPCDSNLLEST